MGIKARLPQKWSISLGDLNMRILSTSAVINEFAIRK